MQQQFEQLKCSKSLQLVEDMPVSWPGNREENHLKVSNILKSVKKNKVYAYNHKVIAFVYRGDLFVTPYTEESLDIIRNSGFKLHEFFVPFSKGDQPLGEYGEKWQALIASVKPVIKSAHKQAVSATSVSLQPAVAAV